MSFPRAWARLPGPADFIDALIRDLEDRSIVFAGLPESIIDDIKVEVADSVNRKSLGKWIAVPSTESHALSPRESIEKRTMKGDGTVLVWVDVREEGAMEVWTRYARRIASSVDKPRLCIAMAMERAERHYEEQGLQQGLRRRLWKDFVSATDSYVFTERYHRNNGYGSEYIALKSTVIARIADSDLSYAEKLNRKHLKDLIKAGEYPHEHIWAAQVSVLFPLLDKQRRHLLESYREHWELPYIRKNSETGAEIEIIQYEDLEFGDMSRQAKAAEESGGVLGSKLPFFNWLRQVRNDLAHYKIVKWSTLKDRFARNVMDFRGPR